jgi:NAD(P)-dependent dehydrogenase (short-subunit alcohol dehydrogenase family)
VDVTNWEKLLSLFVVVRQKHGRIDLVFANAGVGEKASVFTDILETNGILAPPDLTVIDVNLKGVIYSALLTSWTCEWTALVIKRTLTPTLSD